MIVITEDTARQTYFKEGKKEIHVPEGAFVTKEALDYAREHGLAFRHEKPEHMTHLWGNVLVPKNHLRIVLRGKLDTLQANIIEGQILAEKLEEYQVMEDLESALSYTRKILAAEVRNEPLPEIQLFSKTQDQLREESHHPKKYFQVDHLLPSYEMGELLAKLNLLRAMARETEIAAVSAFLQGETLERTDLIHALNRLSSGFYVLMLKLVSEGAHYSGIKEWSGLWL